MSRFYELVTSGKVLSHDEATLVRDYLSKENGDGEDAYLEIEMSDGQSLTAEVATLLSEWRPKSVCACIDCNTHSLSDEAARAISVWGGADPDLADGGELQLCGLSMISDAGAQFLRNSVCDLRVNVQQLPDSVVAILREMDVEQDFGEGEILFAGVGND